VANDIADVFKTVSSRACCRCPSCNQVMSLWSAVFRQLQPPTKWTRTRTS